MLRFRNPLKKRDVPEHMVVEERKFHRWLGLTATFSLLITCFALISTPLIMALLGYGVRTLVALPLFDKFYWYYHDISTGYFIAMQHLFLKSMGVGGIWGWISYTAIGLIAALITMIPQLFNPYEPSNKNQGDVRWADDRTLDQMHERKQVGIIGAKYGSLGIWTTGKHAGKPLRLIETLSVLCLAPPGTGKCLGADVKVLMYDGTIKRNRDLVPGDLLMGPDGKPRTIRSTKWGFGPMFQVTPEIGEPYTCNGDHILSLRSENLSPYMPPAFRTVRDYLQFKPETQQRLRQWQAPVQFRKDSHPDLHAYDIGVMQVYEQNCVQPTRVSSLPDLHAPDPGSDIPFAVTRGSRADRLDFLAGIIDAAATVSEDGATASFLLDSPTLVEAVLFTARSLGLTAFHTNDPHGTRSVLVTLGGALSTIPSRLHKLAGPDRTLFIQSPFKIEPAGYGAFHGIIIDGDGQFLLADFTVTHNTAAFVVPALIDTTASSFLVNDSKPELAPMTSGYRSTLGPVFILDWAKIDKPEEGLFYPRFNFLSPLLVPPAGPDRDTYVDTVAKALLPDDDKGSDSYFVSRGRAILTAFMHFLVAKVGDEKNYDGIPEKWVGKEPCIAMISDFVAYAQYLSRNAEKEDQENEPQQSPQGGDAISRWLEGLSKQCDPVAYAEKIRNGSSEQIYNAARAFNEFVNLSTTGDKERASIMGTMDTALLPFKNPAVAERTSACDFTPDDLRGMRDPVTGEFKPITIFICSNQAEAAAFARITALFYEVFSLSLLTFGPNDYNHRTRRTLGPYSVCFLLDEFAKLPRMDAVLDGPDLGRSKQVYYFFFAQSDAQITNIYKQERRNIIMSTTAGKILLPQNDFSAVELFQKLVGTTTVRQQKYNYTEGLSKGASPFASGRSEETTSVNFLRNEDVTAMAPGYHIVLFQGYLNRPMKLKTQFFFNDPVMKNLVYSRGNGIPPSAALPDYMAKRRSSLYHLDRKRQRNRRLITARKEQRDAWRAPAALRHGP